MVCAKPQLGLMMIFPHVLNPLEGNSIINILLHVDDFLAATNNTALLYRIINSLDAKYGIKKLGPAAPYHIQRNRSARTITLHHHDYIANMLESARMTHCTPSPSKGPLFISGITSEDSRKTQEDIIAMKSFPYHQLTGCLQHIASHARPDISLEVSTLSKFNHNPGKKHWEALKQLLRYLKHTSQWGLILGGTDVLTLMGYSDSSFASDPTTSRTAGGFIFKLGQSKSKWFQAVFLSSTEAEFAAQYGTENYFPSLAIFAAQYGTENYFPSLAIFQMLQPLFSLTMKPQSNTLTQKTR